MAEKVTIGNAELWHGDCREVLPLLSSFDACVTDPPYGLPREEPFADVVAGLALVRYTVAAIILDWRNPIRSANKVGELVWEYGWVSGFRSRAKHGVNHTHNTIHLLGDATRLHFTDGSIIARRPGFSSPRHCSFATKSGHPYEKPVALMRWLLERIDGGPVCDPYMGSGSTGVACIQLGRKFVGIEIDRQYFEIACERIEREQRQTRLAV